MSNTLKIVWADPDDINNSSETQEKTADQSSGWQDLTEVPFAGDKRPEDDTSSDSESIRDEAEHSAELIAESDKLFNRITTNLEEQNTQLRGFCGNRVPSLFAENGYSYNIADRLGDQFGYGATEVARLSSQRFDALRSLVEGTFPIGDESSLDPQKLANLREEYLTLGSKKSSVLSEMLSSPNNAFGPDVQRNLSYISESADWLSHAEDKFILDFLDNPSKETLDRLWQNSSNGTTDVGDKTVRAGYALDDFSQSVGYRSGFSGDIGSFSRKYGDAHNETTRSLIDFLDFRATENLARNRADSHA